MPILSEKDFCELVSLPDNSFWRSVSKAVLRVLSMEKLNGVYDRLCSKQGQDFAQAFFEDQKVNFQIGNAQRLKTLPEGPFITISNHPYGHIDGMMLIDVFGHLRPEYKVMVNSMLARVKTLDPNFITVIPNGNSISAPKTESISGVRLSLEHLRSGGSMGIFPSGAVSDLSLRDRCVRDRQWQDAALKLIRKAQVPIVPVRFFDRNSDFYYMLGLIHYIVRLLRLPSEALNKGGKQVRLGIGEVISVEQQKACSNLDEFSALLRNSVYGMALPDSFVYRSELFTEYLKTYNE